MKRSKFSLSHYKLLSCNMGSLVPIGLVEVLPGDTIQHATSCLIRMSPMLAPVMHPVHARIHHWFVPHRLVWDDWEKFITGGEDGLDASVHPTVAADWAQGSLADYLGVPPGTYTPDLAVSALPFRGYSLIWNEWYRDEDLQTKLVISKTSGVDTTTNRVMQNVDWEKDYFTSARPWEQKGPSVTVPLGTSAPVKGIGTRGTQAGESNVAVRETDNSNPTYTSANTFAAAPANDLVAKLKATGASWRPDITVDLSQASAVSVNVLRQALALQRFEEARARYGSRYTEYLRYLGVRSSDARLQRPEYLGGGKQTLQFSEVLQTGVTTSGNPAGVGTMRGHGIGAMRSNRYRRFFEEHGYVFSLLSVKPRTMYVQGVPRTWNRTVKTDYFQRELQHIGQQVIKNKELYAAAASPDGTFGYQDRYDEYRRMESSIAGEFRATTLDFWHMARVFASEPALNAAFVSSVPTTRIFASAATDTLYVMGMHSIQARRLLTKRGSSFTF